MKPMVRLDSGLIPIVRKKIARLDVIQRPLNDAADIAQWRAGKLSGAGLLAALRERGQPKAAR